LTIAAAALLAAAPAWGNEAPRFDSKDVLESLDLFANQRADANAGLGERLKVDFSFRGRDNSQEPGFLYLREGETGAGTSGGASAPSLGFTPRLSALGGLGTARDSRGQSRNLATFTPRHAGASLSLSFDPDADPTTGNALGLGFSSEFLIESANPALRPMALGSGLGPDPLQRRTTNFGLSLDYFGFQMGASLTRETGGLEAGFEGIDVGLGYAWSAFRTEFSVGSYSVLDSDLALVGRGRDFTRLELGAAYAVSERLRVSGGVQLFDYGSRFGLTSAGREGAGVLYLGTRLNF